MCFAVQKKTLRLEYSIGHTRRDKIRQRANKMSNHIFSRENCWKRESTTFFLIKENIFFSSLIKVIFDDLYFVREEFIALESNKFFSANAHVTLTLACLRDRTFQIRVVIHLS